MIAHSFHFSQLQIFVIEFMYAIYTRPTKHRKISLNIVIIVFEQTRFITVVFQRRIYRFFTIYNNNNKPVKVKERLLGIRLTQRVTGSADFKFLCRYI